jgi:hypothetical protein
MLVTNKKAAVIAAAFLLGDDVIHPYFHLSL